MELSSGNEHCAAPLDEAIDLSDDSEPDAAPADEAVAAEDEEEESDEEEEEESESDDGEDRTVRCPASFSRALLLTPCATSHAQKLPWSP